MLRTATKLNNDGSWRVNGLQEQSTYARWDHDKFIVMGRGTARSSNRAPNNATQTKQKAHKQE